MNPVHRPPTRGRHEPAHSRGGSDEHLQTEKAPSSQADAFSAIEDALLSGWLDVSDELHRRFPPGKPPVYRKTRLRHRELMRKRRVFDAAMVGLDRVRGQERQLVMPLRPAVPEPRAPKANGGSHWGRHEHDAATLRAAHPQG